MKKYSEILKKCSLFDNISEENLLEMLKCLDSKIICYQKNETVINEGEPAKHIGIVLSGSVQIMRIDYYGNKSIMTSIGASQIFGESFACAEVKEMPVNVIASEDSEIMFIDCKKVLNSCSNSCVFHNRIIYNLMKVVARKNLIFNEKIEITSKRTTREKLMTYLMLQAKKHGSNEFSILYSRQELADFLEVERSGLSAEISKLRRENIIKCKKNRFKLL